jgi:hypothetical protein
MSEIVFRKSSKSCSGGCVEVAMTPGGVLVRDTKDNTGPMLTFTAHEWHAFVAGAKSGEFDDTAGVAGASCSECAVD